MRAIAGFLLLACYASSAWAQSGIVPKTVLPKHVATNNYQSGKVLVKVKSAYKHLFQTASEPGARRSSLLQTKRITSLAPKGSLKNTAARAQAFIPSVDITQYFELSFDPSQSVEAYINMLYASGYIEIAEPVVRMEMQFTPNDTNIGSQYYLTKIKALEAWDITQGSEDIIIAIVDSGVDMDHPDFANKCYINQVEATGAAGVDDDANGYIDDIRGWDFSGADTLNVFNPNYAGDNDPAIYKSGPGFTHGTQVGGCAGAATNNGEGIAGVAYKTKLLFTKHYADNQKTSDRNYSSDTYKGVLYAAYQGAKIINCSWGGNVRSQVYQDFINYVTNDLGCLVIAAAGNSNVGAPLYPASYDNVISVAATDQNDVRANFTNYGAMVDISAPGVGILTTAFDNGYQTPQGTSFSSPIVAGAAALVWSVFPSYTPQQVAEQLRVSADASMYDQNPSFINKLGKGRLDILQALTATLPSIRAENYKLVNASGSTAGPGDNALLYFDFKNILAASSSGLEITVSSSSPNITITEGKIIPGSIGAGATMSNKLTPFKLTINPAVTENEEVDILISYTDGAYQDFQLFTFIPNPTFIDIDDNRITTTISAAGRLGYENTDGSTHGSGFQYNDHSLLYEMGLIMGSSSSDILNTVRNASGGFDQDFVKTTSIREIVPGLSSDSEISGAFSNSTTSANQKVVVSYKSMVWKETPYDKFVIVEYKIKNPQATAITNYYMGLFADWDVNVLGGDGAQWDAARQLGYVFPKKRTDLPHVGIQLLTASPHYYAIDNSETIAQATGSFGIYTNFTDANKFTSISTNRLQAGISADGNDVSEVVSAGPFTINPNQEITIAFALHAADDLAAIQQSADVANVLYNYTLQEEPPIIPAVQVCYGSDATLKATGATKYKWYKNFTGGEALVESDELSIPNVTNDTTLYVSNATNSFESVRTAATIHVMANPTIRTSRDADLCTGDTIILSVDPATSYNWSNGQTTQSIAVSDAGAYHVTVKYDNDALPLHCESASDDFLVTVRSRPVASMGVLTSATLLYTGKEILFDEDSQDASAWYWDFGDGTTSNMQNPKKIYETGDNFTLSLTVTSSNGCMDSDTRNITIITSNEVDVSKSISLYPVPVTADDLIVNIEGLQVDDIPYEVLTAEGKLYRQSAIKPSGYAFQYSLSTHDYANGFYVLRLSVKGITVIKKFTVVR